MNRKELKQSIVSIIDENIIQSEKCDTSTEAIADKILSLIPGWISVSERLPEVGQSDNWNIGNKISVDVWTFSEFGMKRGRYYHWVGIWTIDGVSSSNGINITHWMPLPNKPEGV